MVVRTLGTVVRDGTSLAGGKKGWESQLPGSVFNLDGGCLGLTQYTELKLKGEGL